MKHGQSSISGIHYTLERTNMARQQTESGEESYKLQVLRPQVEELCNEFDALVDTHLDDREDLAAIFKVLEQIMATKISPPQQGDGKKVDDDDDKVLPRSKREELGNLLPLIRSALEQRRSKPPRGQQDAAAAASSAAADSEPPPPASSGCIPCTPRAASQQQSKKQQQQQEQEQQEKKEAGNNGVSLKLLLRLTQNVVEPEEYYEWTTSYVDEERIYGWEKEAGEVIDALVAPDGSERMFRAAGVAGVHGSGKTALAQKVFVHDRAKDNFALRLWVCVGPPDSEDRFNLLYRMLDNLGLDTAKVEDIVDKSKVVGDAKDQERKRIMEMPDAIAAELRKKAADIVAARRPATAGVAGQAVETPDDGAPSVVTEATHAGAGDDDANSKQAKEEEDRIRIFEELLREKIDNSRAVEKSRIGVLLYILNTTLSKTSYMIVFDDIRAYRRAGDGDDGCWYSNLTLAPPAEGEWGDRLGYGLPKGREHRGAVLVTCRKEDDAKTMARTGLVVRPPRLDLDGAWKLFRREYGQAKDDRRSKEGGKAAVEGEEDLLLKQLEQMKKEIVDKCLGLPIAIVEAAKGFAGLDPLPEYLPDDDASPEKEAAADQATPAAAAAEAGGHSESTNNNKDMLHQAEEEKEAAAAPAAEAAADESE